MSIHEVEVVPVALEPHGNADSLSVVRVGGWQCVVKTAEWKDKAVGAYVPPDYVCPNTPQYEFLGSSRRVRVRRFRGVLSQGLLLQAPEGSKLGDNVIDTLGITKYEPPDPISTGGDNEQAPPGYYPKYDVESWEKYKYLFNNGEETICSEKLHGCSSKYLWNENRMFCGSRTNWKKESDSSVWWKALKSCPWIVDFCRTSPSLCLYGEVYGQVQDLKYGHAKGQVSFRAFDVLNIKEGRWLSFHELDALQPFLIYGEACWVPVLYRGPYSEEVVREHAKGQSTILGADHVREGCVVRPVTERWTDEIGRLQLKKINDDYLERA